MKVEEVQKNVEGGIKGIGNFIKRNPFVAIIGVIVVIFLVFLFGRPRREREEVAAPQQLPQPQAMPVEIPVPMPVEVPVPMPVEVPVHKIIEKPIPKPIEVPVPKVIEKPIFIEPPVQPDMKPQVDYEYRDDIAWKEEFAAQLDAIQDALRVDRVEAVDPVIDVKVDPYVLDFYADPQRYVKEIMREDVFRPPRPRKNGLILTAAGEWEPIEDVIARQKQRYKDALARGDIKWAEIVRRETEIALGHTVDW